MKLFKKKTVIFILLILIFGGYFGYKNLAKEEAEVRYILAAAEKGTIVVSVSGSGQVSALDQIDIKPKVAGEARAIYVNKDQTVKSGQLLAELDVREAERAVRDVEISLVETRESLQKTKENYEKIVRDIETSLPSVHQDGLDSLVNAFKEMNLMIPDLELMFTKSSYGSKESDINYYLYLVRSYSKGDLDLFPYWDDVPEKKFLPLKRQFDEIRKEYLMLHQNSLQEQIKSVLDQTYNLSRDILDLVRQTSNLTEKYQTILNDENSTPPISQTITDSHASQLTKFDSTLSIQANSLQKNRDAIDDFKENIPQKIKDAKSAVDKAQDDLVKKEEALSDAREKLANHFIRAPFDGVIVKINAKKGDSVTTAAALATLITHQKIAEISLNEIDAAKVKVGQKATLSFDALPELTITGKVVEIDTVGTVSQGVISYGVKIALDIDDERIKPSMSVMADIIVEAKTDVLVLPNSAIKFQASVYYVELVEAPEETKGQLLATRTGVVLAMPPKMQAVETGLSGDLSIEIVSGLKEGDVVVSSTISPGTVQTTQNQGTQQFQIPGMGGQRGMMIR